MRGITPAQNKKIHMLAKEYGMDDDLLHAMIEAETRKDSIKKLTIMEAVKIIDRLEGRAQSYDAKHEHMTYRQEAYIKGLAKDMGWIDEKGYADTKRISGFVSKFYGIDNYKWLTKSMAGKVIEGLKKMAEKQEVKEA